MNQHLTTEQMEASLMEPVSSERSQHLQECEACREEFESLAELIGDLRTAAVGSAERHYRVAARPVMSHARPRMIWGLAAATALLCVSTPIVLHHRPGHPVALNVPQRQVASAADSDDQLLSNVQEDLSASVPSAMLPLAFTYATNSTNASASNAKENE